MLEVEPIGECGHMTSRSGQDVFEAEKIASLISGKPSELECGPMPNVMVALHAEHRWRPLFNAAKFG